MTSTSFTESIGIRALTGPRTGLDPDQARARFHEHALFYTAHPIPSLVGELAARRGPLVTFPGVAHFITDVTLAREVLSDPDRFSKTGVGAVGAIMTQVMGEYALLNMEGEAHRQLRGRLAGLFTPRFVRDLVAEVFEAPLASARETLARGESLDVARLAQVLTGRMLCAMFGIDLVPGEEEATCLELYRNGVALGSLVPLTKRLLDADKLTEAKARFDSLTGIARAAYERGDEQTVPGRLRALGLSFEEARGVLGVLFLAGTETTATSLPRIVALLIDSRQWELVREERGLLPRAIDEGLRVTTPVPVMTRSVTQRTTLHGRTLEANDRVVVFMAHLPRSAKYFEDPMRFDVRREHPRDLSNLWFGHGAHFCLGFSLARREIELVIGALLDAGELVVDRRSYGRKVLFPGYAELSVRAARR